LRADQRLLDKVMARRNQLAQGGFLFQDTNVVFERICGGP
jgi:hypothetical protein